MRKYFALFIFFFSSSIGIAQNNLPRVYEITTDTAKFIKLEGQYSQILEDPRAKWTIEEVSSSPIADNFHPNRTQSEGIDYSINTFWVRYRFKNNMDHEARVAIPKFNFIYADLYSLPSMGTPAHKMTGAGVPWSKRSDLKAIMTATYVIPPGEELLIYERNRFDYFIDKPNFLEVRFGFTDNVVRHYYNDGDPFTADPNVAQSILPSFVFGLFLLAAIFNFYFFVIVRRRVYLFFSLTLLCHGFSRFFESNNFFFREHPMFKLHVASFSGVLYFFFLIHFLRYFLETFKYFPRGDKYLFGLSIYIIIYSFLVDQNIIVLRYEDILGPFIIAISILITLIMLLGSSGKDAWLAIVATLPIICITLIPSLLPIRFMGEWFVVLEQIGLIWLLSFFSWSLFERYQQLQKTIAEEALAKERLAKEKEIERSELIAQQKVDLEKQVTDRTAELKQSLEDLKATQAQLIQSEKMASLGELTAGIAHEIQNPLNFVNNFSEVNAELISEMELQAQGGNIEEVKSIAKDIRENEEKINYHGKRADAIVKGMLQHSRASSGQKELTDINALCDEYLRLAYHGLRAKDKSFNAKIKTHFDLSIGKISIVPQEIGRVILNLINNAFYAVQEKQKQNLNGYEPMVTVNTTRHDGKVEINVEDNGNGIPRRIVEKIFQPFFTTKPAGQGTGLGLSLAYDIVKVHGGEIKVGTKEGEGTEFIFQLPIK